MLFHIRLLMESFATVAARVRSSVTVNQQMCRQSTASFKRFATLLTLLREKKN